MAAPELELLLEDEGEEELLDEELLDEELLDEELLDEELLDEEVLDDEEPEGEPPQAFNKSAQRVTPNIFFMFITLVKGCAVGQESPAMLSSARLISAARL